ncbi:MAG: ATP-dependent DNA ligase [Candidatus Aenigmarchaeota archaeon]|nr:ATP-dependent DNA ligase [Candidatus Aenigmarchaeota archaeon]
MQYSKLADLYEKLESTAKKLEKRDVLAEFYKKSDSSIGKVVMMSTGSVFPAGSLDLGLARGLMKKIIAKSSGSSLDAVNKTFKETGDLGLTAEHLMQKKKQVSLGSHVLTVEKVFSNLKELPNLTGKGSQERKVDLVVELLSHASPKEARYIVRTVIGGMRIGVAEGIVRDAIALAFEKEPKEVEHAFNVLGDFGLVAEMAQKGDLKADAKLFQPIRVMLAESAADLKEAMEAFKEPLVQTKYDGFRVQCHKDGNKVRVFSRRLDEVTHQFPDIEQMVKANVNAKQCIIEGEVIAVDSKGNPQPFQSLSRRIQRKHDIDKMVRDIQVQVNLFDVIYLNGKSLMNNPLKERWQELKKIIKENKSFCFADTIETNDYEKAEKFYQNSLKMGQEGVMVKNLSASYQPGKRVGFWLKIKPIMEPLDLVVVGAEWGEGKRAKWLSSMILAARSGSELLETGRMASGFTEDQLEQLTKKLKPLIIEEKEKIARIRPEIVIEIGYEEIQRSPKYPSGFALRFPRLLRLRDDKSPKDANTVKDIEKLFAMQKKRK